MILAVKRNNNFLKSKNRNKHCIASNEKVVTEFVDTISGSVESSSSKLHTMSTASPTRKHTYFSVISYMQRMFSVKTNMYVAIRHSMFFKNTTRCQQLQNLENKKYHKI
jgi:hypothetical protein